MNHDEKRPSKRRKTAMPRDAGPLFPVWVWRQGYHSEQLVALPMSLGTTTNQITSTCETPVPKRRLILKTHQA